MPDRKGSGSGGPGWGWSRQGVQWLSTSIEILDSPTLPAFVILPVDSREVGIHCNRGLGPPVIRAPAGVDPEQEGFFLIGLSRGLSVKILC